MHSPWGQVDFQERLAPGVLWVSTPGHGGVRIETEIISLSSPALRRGISEGQYRWYEEDCEYAIPILELPETWRGLFPKKSIEEIRQILLQSLSAWNADYLLERGIQPEPVAYQGYLARKQDDEMRAAKHPDLIIAALNAVQASSRYGQQMTESIS